MKNIFSLIILAAFLCAPVHAFGKGALKEEEIARVKECKEMLGSVDTKSFSITVKDLEKSDYPQTNLAIMEAVAKTYAEIVKEQSVKIKSKKDWLYSMVSLNMAYLQFGGIRPPKGKSAALNKIIIGKLRKHLPDDILKQPGFLHTVEE